MIQGFVHYGIHFLGPLLLALLIYRTNWVKTFVILLSTFIIDLDHLLAMPIFDPNRCSIDFHPLHSYFAIGLYVCLLIPSKTRLVGLGLCIHIFADYCDCLFI